MIISMMDRKEMEQLIGDKLNELANLINGWHGHEAQEFTFGISETRVYGYIYNKDGDNPLDFSRPRKMRKPDRLFTPGSAFLQIFHQVMLLQHRDQLLFH